MHTAHWLAAKELKLSWLRLGFRSLSLKPIKSSAPRLLSSLAADSLRPPLLSFSGSRIPSPSNPQIPNLSALQLSGSWRGFCSASRDSQSPKGELVRDFVHDALYAPDSGYFQEREVVGKTWEQLDSRQPSGSQGAHAFRHRAEMPAGIDFNNLLGEAEYRWEVSKIYQSSGEAWLTPTELFHPWYARAVAKSILEALAEDPSPYDTVKVIEIGGGNGTFARTFLDFVKDSAPQVYKKLKYQLIEVSDTLAAKQNALVTSAHKRAEVLRHDATTWQPPAPGPRERHAVIALEVLDNMPHDKLVATPKGLCEVWVVDEGEGPMEEIRALADPLIVKYLQTSGMLASYGFQFADGLITTEGNSRNDREHSIPNFWQRSKSWLHQQILGLNLDSWNLLCSYSPHPLTTHNAPSLDPRY